LTFRISREFPPCFAGVIAHFSLFIGVETKMNSQEVLASAILLIVLFGTLGNAMSLILFSRPNMRSYSVNVLLCALAFVDLCLLLFAIPVFVLPNLSFLW
jgi:hypothetical protein